MLPETSPRPPATPTAFIAVMSTLAGCLPVATTCWPRLEPAGAARDQAGHVLGRVRAVGLARSPGRARVRPRAGTRARCCRAGCPRPRACRAACAIRYAKCFMCQAITLLTASVPLLAGIAVVPELVQVALLPGQREHVHVRLEHRELQRRDPGQIAGERHVHQVAEHAARAAPRRCSRGWSSYVFSPAASTPWSPPSAGSAPGSAGFWQVAVLAGGTAEICAFQVADLVEVARQALLVGACRASGSTSASAVRAARDPARSCALRSRKSCLRGGGGVVGRGEVVEQGVERRLRADRRRDRERLPARRRVRLVGDHVAAVRRRHAQVPVRLHAVDERLERRAAGDGRRDESDPR